MVRRDGGEFGGVFLWYSFRGKFVVCVPDDPSAEGMGPNGGYTLLTFNSEKKARKICAILNDVYNMGVENGIINGVQVAWEINEDLQEDLDEIDPSDILEPIEGETLHQKFHRARSQSKE